MTEDRLKEIEALAGVVKPALAEALGELIAEVRRLRALARADWYERGGIEPGESWSTSPGKSWEPKP